MGAAPMVAQVERQDPPVITQPPLHEAPIASGAEQAMQQNNRPAAADGDRFEDQCAISSMILPICWLLSIRRCALATCSNGKTS